jgi:hypothetical protein
MNAATEVWPGTKLLACLWHEVKGVKEKINGHARSGTYRKLLLDRFRAWCKRGDVGDTPDDRREQFKVHVVGVIPADGSGRADIIKQLTDKLDSSLASRVHGADEFTAGNNGTSINEGENAQVKNLLAPLASLVQVVDSVLTIATKRRDATRSHREQAETRWGRCQCRRRSRPRRTR